LVDGNTGGTIAMYLANFAAFATIIFSLAEMSSMRVLPCWAGLTEADNASQGTNRWRTVSIQTIETPAATYVSH